MWGCNEQWLWQRLPGDEQRAALCPDGRTREKEMDEEGETDELNEMSLLLKGWGG